MPLPLWSNIVKTKPAKETSCMSLTEDDGMTVLKPKSKTCVTSTDGFIQADFDTESYENVDDVVDDTQVVASDEELTVEITSTKTTVTKSKQTTDSKTTEDNQNSQKPKQSESIPDEKKHHKGKVYQPHRKWTANDTTKTRFASMPHSPQFDKRLSYSNITSTKPEHQQSDVRRVNPHKEVQNVPKGKLNIEVSALVVDK